MTTKSESLSGHTAVEPRGGKPSSLPSNRITLDQITDLSTRCFSAVEAMRARMLDSEHKKVPPTFTAASLATLCRMTRHQLEYRLKQQGSTLPLGSKQAGSSLREFTLEEALVWKAAVGAPVVREAPGQRARVVLANFKGGVSKTSTAVSLAQGLTLHGMKVLLVDLDPQASATTLMGINPESEVNEEETLLTVFAGEMADPSALIRKTYWTNLDIIPSASALHGAEFLLASRQMQERKSGFLFSEVLDHALGFVDPHYDAIVIDTPPSLGFTTINALVSGDVILVPLPPEMLDFASLAQFWTLFDDLAGSLNKQRGKEKTYAGIHVFHSKVKASSIGHAAVSDAAAQAYRNWKLPVEIPLTEVVSTASMQFQTVYDISRYTGDYRTYRRAREAYDSLVEALIPSIKKSWATTGDDQ